MLRLRVVPVLIFSAVLVWARALGLLTPLSSKLGAMLYTVCRAAEEVGVLVPVVLVLMLVSMCMWTMSTPCPLCSCSSPP
jgi:hypothetical protein